MRIESTKITHIELNQDELEYLVDALDELTGQLKNKPDDFGWSTEARIFLNLLYQNLGTSKHYDS